MSPITCGARHAGTPREAVLALVGGGQRGSACNPVRGAARPSTPGLVPIAAGSRKVRARRARWGLRDAFRGSVPGARRPCHCRRPGAQSKQNPSSRALRLRLRRRGRGPSLEYVQLCFTDIFCFKETNMFERALVHNVSTNSKI